MQIEIAFPVQGETIPIDHAYLLYSALSHCVRDFHDEEANIRFSPINGIREDKRIIRLLKHSRLHVRLPANQIAIVLPLAGRTLEIGGHRIALQPPTVLPIMPVPTLSARIVTFKNALDPEQFLITARLKLVEKNITGEPGIPLIEQGKRAGEPRRWIVRIKGKQIVGYALQVEGLTADESLRLQEEGLGGRCRMGCGFFVPLQPRSS